LFQLENVHILFVSDFVNNLITSAVIFKILRFTFNFKNQNLVVSNIENWEQDVTNEITELHDFFQNWFNGTIPQSEFSKFSDVLDPEFKIISPWGELTEKTELERTLKNSYKKNSKIKITVRNISVHKVSMDIYLAIYEEIQTQDLKLTIRLSSALFCRNGESSNNYNWLHVHETWKSVQ